MPAPWLSHTRSTPTDLPEEEPSRPLPRPLHSVRMVSVFGLDAAWNACSVGIIKQTVANMSDFLIAGLLWCLMIIVIWLLNHYYIFPSSFPDFGDPTVCRRHTGLQKPGGAHPCGICNVCRARWKISFFSLKSVANTTTKNHV